MKPPEPSWPWQPTDQWREANPKGPILAIVGSRKFLNPNAYSLALGVISMALEAVRPRLVISGGADGMDKFGESVALLSRLPFQEFLPQCNRWEPDGYKERNDLIAWTSTHLLCIRCQGSATAGSAYTAGVAARLGRPVKMMNVPIGGNFVNYPSGLAGATDVRR